VAARATDKPRENIEERMQGGEGTDQKRERNLLWIIGRRAHNGHALGQHDLVSNTSMQVPATEEASLGGVRVDPAADGHVLAVDVVEQGDVALLRHLARVGRADLVRDDEAADEKGV